MATKGEELAATFEQANRDFIATVEPLTAQQWARDCEEVGWSVGVTAHHIAEGHAALAEIVGRVAGGQGIEPFTPDMLNAANAEHARRAANATKEETIALAHGGGQTARQTLRGLTDQQLEQTATFDTPSGPQTLTAASIAENVLIGHIGMHLAMIQRAVS